MKPIEYRQAIFGVRKMFRIDCKVLVIADFPLTPAFPRIGPSRGANMRKYSFEWIKLQVN